MQASRFTTFPPPPEPDPALELHSKSVGFRRGAQRDDSLCGERSTFAIQLLWRVV